MTSNHILKARLWLDRALEFSWLAAVAVVPLIAFPESEFISLIGMPKTTSLRIIASVAVLAWIGHFAVWATERALFEYRMRAITAGAPDGSLQGTSASGKWVLGSTVALAVITVISTLLSINPAVSTWGKLAGSEGYGLYTTASLLVLFFTVALKLRERRQMSRLLGVVAVVGIISALTGIAQSIDFWPVRERVYTNRVSGHSGNPIAYGSLVLTMFPIAIAAVLLWNRHRPTLLRLWLPLLGVHFVFMYAVALTLSRGPYLGMAVAVLVMPVLIAVAVGRKFAARMVAVSAVSALIVAGLMVLPSANAMFIGSDDLVSEPGEGLVDDRDTPSVSTRIGTTATIETRLQIWRASQGLIEGRPAVPGSQGTDNGLIRHLFGYGPDQFRYVVGLTAEPITFYRTISEAHNDFLNRAVDTGLLGLGAFIAILATTGLLLLSLLRMSRRVRNFETGILAAAIAAALAGRLFEQQVGISRNSDLVIFWVMLGMAIALPRLLAQPSAAVAQPAPRTRKAAAVTVVTPVMPMPRRAAGYAFALSLVAIVTGTLVFVTWQKNVNYVMADHQARVARDLRANDPRQAIVHYQSALDLAPDVAKYRVELGDYYGALAGATLNPQEQLTLLQANYEADLEAVRINELERDPNFQLAESAWNLASYGDTEKAQVTVERYRFLHEIAPEYALVRTRLNEIVGVLQGSAN